MEQSQRKRVLSVQLPRGEKLQRLSEEYTNSDNMCIVGLQGTVGGSDSTIDSSSCSDSMTEYEVSQISPVAENPFFSTEDSDEINEINEIAELGAVVAAVKYTSALNDSDVGQLADTSTELSTSPTSNSDVDPELPRLDYLDFWTCAQCKAVNANRHVPFCSKCYEMRKNFFPPRPRRRRGFLPTRSDSGIDVTDSPIQSSQSLNVDVVDGPIKPQRSGEEDSKDKCPICYVRPIDGLFLHGNTAHSYCCYKCGKTVWRKSGKCPLCRRRLQRVVKLLQVDK